MAFEHEACDVILEERPGAEQRSLNKLLLRLRSEDELLVYTLEAFQRSTGEIAQLLRHLMRTGVVLRLAQENQQFAPVGDTISARQMVELLAAHEDNRRGKPNTQNLRSGSRNPLSRFQTTYARKLYKQGAPVRTIGLLFQLPPDVIREVVGDPTD
jgi:DNA invertase Pin-like site-specific DNA recombinase